MCARVLALFVCVVAVSAAPAVSSKKAFLEPKTNDVVVSLMSDLSGVHGKEAAEAEEAKGGAEEDAEQESEEDAEQEAEEDAEQQAEQEAEGAEEDPVRLIDAREAAEEEEDEEEANAGAEEDEGPTYVLREQEAEQDEEDEEQDEEEKAVRQSPSALQRRRVVRSTVRRRRRTVAVSTAVNGVGVRRRRTVVASTAVNGVGVRRRRTVAKYSWGRAAAAELEASEDAAIQKIRLHMENGHKLQQQQLQISQDRYDRITTKRYACTDAGVRAELKKIIASQRRIGQQGLNKKQHQETQLFLRRQKCMKKFSGDQSKKKSPRVEYCMSTVSAQEKAPVAQDQGLTLYEKVAVKKQTDRFQQMLDHAMKASLTDLVNSEHIWDEYSRVCSVFSESEQKQMQDTWENDNKQYLKQCVQSTPP